MCGFTFSKPTRADFSYAEWLLLVTSRTAGHLCSLAVVSAYLGTGGIGLGKSMSQYKLLPLSTVDKGIKEGTAVSGAHMCVRAHAHIWIYEWRGRRGTTSMDVSRNIPPCVLRRGSLLAWALSIQLGCLARNPQKIAGIILCSPQEKNYKHMP